MYIIFSQDIEWDNTVFIHCVWINASALQTNIVRCEHVPNCVGMQPRSGLFNKANLPLLYCRICSIKAVFNCFPKHSKICFWNVTCLWKNNSIQFILCITFSLKIHRCVDRQTLYQSQIGKLFNSSSVFRYYNI